MAIAAVSARHLSPPEAETMHDGFRTLPMARLSAEDLKGRVRPRRRAAVVFVALSLLAAMAGAVVYLLGRGEESTDNAQVEGHLIQVSTRVAGQVARVLVADNQQVNGGDLLVEIDRGDLETRLLAARAELKSAQAGVQAARAEVALIRESAAAGLRQARGGVMQARAGFGGSRASIVQTQAEVAAARSRHDLQQSELSRARRLYDQGALTPAELEAKEALLTQAGAALDQAQARLDGAHESRASWIGSVETARGRLRAARTGPRQIEAAEAALAVASARAEQAQAGVRQAELNLSYTYIKAPARGLVSRKAVEVGQLVSPERPLLVLVGLDDVWVSANFKEDQIAAMRPGQPVRLRIDAFPGRAFAAHVDSLAGAAGARFALLPADNSSGNFIKVVQRIPVLLRFNGHPAALLLPGMSATATVLTAAR